MNSLSLDPTRTTMMRLQYQQKFSSWFIPIKGMVNRLIIDEDALALKKGSYITENTRWGFETSAGKVEKFEQWLQRRIDRGVLSVRNNGITDRMVQQGYDRGNRRGYSDARRKSQLFTSGNEGAAREGLRLRQTDIDRLKALQARTFRDLKGVTEAMANQMTRVLSDGLVRGDSPAKIAKALNDRVDKIGITRARAIARTEIVRAHAEGALDAMERAGLEEVAVSVEWHTTSKPCKLCQPLANQIFTIEQARGMFPRHVNCLCSPIPSNKKPDLRRSKAAVRRSQKAEGATTWS